MIRASGLYGRAIVDLDTAERVGDVDEIIVDPSGPGVAGFVVARDRALFGKRKRLIVPMEAIHAVGPDALTIKSAGRYDERSAHLDSLPRLSELTGRRMVSFGGRLLGAMEDALIDEQDGRIIGYPLEKSGPASWVEAAFGIGWKSDRPDYVRADAGLRIGARLIVVPDEAITTATDLDDEGADGRKAITAPRVYDDPGHSPAEIRAAQDRTSPFAIDDVLTPEERPEHPGEVDTISASSDRPEFDRPEVDEDEDTVLLSTGTSRIRPRRRPQAERMR
jgi:sporulation protein YlmC with PRC-barrel domain